MISTESSTHSSQMYAPRPAISFLTSSFALPQKEQLTSAAGFRSAAGSPLLGSLGLTATMCPLPMFSLSSNDG